ncbi:MAG: STAS domain-containing protein [Acidobacteriota bacterium]|nr:STAS domain-containing protein [Acidobacteriota bacterium]
MMSPVGLNRPERHLRPALEVAIADLDDLTTVIAVKGELDLATAPRLKWPLVDAIDTGHRHIVVDLSGASFMDSTALGVLISARRSMRPDAGMAIVCVDPEVLKIFEISGLDVAFRIFATREEALRHLRASAVQ